MLGEVQAISKLRHITEQTCRTLPFKCIQKQCRRGTPEGFRVRQVGLGKGAGAVKCGEGQIENRHNPFLLFQRR